MIGRYMKNLDYRLVKKIKRKGYPVAHSEADNEGKKLNPKKYKDMKKLSKNKLAGTHTKSGKITISKKVPKSDREDVAFHEFEQARLCKKCGLSKISHRNK